MNLRLFASGPFRSMMALLSPSLLLLGAAKRWGTFYKGGCTLEILKAGRNSADLRIGFPPLLFLSLYLFGLAESFRAAAAATRADNAVAQVTESSDTHALISVTW